MIWYQVIGYFVIWSAVFIAIFSVYAKTLRLIYQLPGLSKFSLAMIVYLIISFILVLPLTGLVFNKHWYLEMKENYFFSVVFLFGYLLSVLSGILHFKINHLAELKSFGYFKD